MDFARAASKETIMNIEQKALSELRWIRILLLSLLLPVVVIVLKALQAIFIPLIFAIFISFVFAPMRSWLSKHKLPFWLNIVLMVLIILLIVSVLGLIIFAAGNSFVQQFPKYQDKLVQQMQYLIELNSQWAARLDLAFASFPSLDPSAFMSGGSFSITGFASRTMGAFMNAGTQILLTLVFLLFLVGEAGKIEKRVRRVLSHQENSQTFDTIMSIQTQIQSYLANKSLLSLCAAGVAMLIMVIFGVDFVIVAGLFYFALSFIPNIGSILSTLFPLSICFLQYGFGLRLAGLLILLSANEMFFGNFVEPRVMGNKMNLSPIVVLISLILWAYVWGPVGMVIAVPITSSINIILRRVDAKNLISAIISEE